MVQAKTARFQTLDAWRGLCCLALVVFHATFQVTRDANFMAPGTFWGNLGYGLMVAASRMWIGVPIFFVISGYCIMATLNSSRHKSNGLVDYFKRRFRRIYPTYWAALALSAATILLVEQLWLPGVFSQGIFTMPNPAQMTPWQWLGNITLTESWRPFLVGDATRHLLPNAWTLCYEEQFYLIVGLLYFFAPRRIFAGTIVVSAVVVVAKFCADRQGRSLEGTFLDGGWLLFFAGVLAYYCINLATPKQSYVVYGLFIAGMLSSLLKLSELQALEANHTIDRFVACGFGLILCVLKRWDSQIVEWKLIQPLSACGRMSYSIYLMHAVVTKFISYALYRAGWQGHWETALVTIPLCLAASLLVSYGFYLLIERRFTNPSQSKPTYAASPPAKAAVA